MSKTEMGVVPGPVRSSGTVADGTGTAWATALTASALSKRSPGKYLLSIVADPANSGKVYVCLAPAEPVMAAAECKAVASVALAAGQSATLEILAGGDSLPLAFLAGDAASQAYRSEIWAVALE